MDTPGRLPTHEAAGESAERMDADRGPAGDEAIDEAAGRGIILHVVKLPEAKKGSVEAEGTTGRSREGRPSVVRSQS